MTFQNFLSRIPKWNQNMIEIECKRIKETSKCDFLEDLITCVHIIQLKILSCVRTSNQSQKIDIDIPSFETFLHNVYINIARKLYSNIYLFQVDVTPLEQQKNTREFEIIVQTCIMNTIRDNIPIDKLLKQYMDETQMQDVEQKIISKEEIVDKDNDTNNVIKDNNKVVEDNDNNNVVNNNENINVPENISFKENVEKFDPVNNEITNEKVNFESKPDLNSTYDNAEEDYDDDDNEILTIGEPINNINIDKDLENPILENYKSEEISSVDLDTLPIENDAPENKNNVIDLNIEEIKI
tara:strand:- start:202 stop:1092 length:891 start_codon:yes stop_codon:yes gene_type:complete